MILTHPDWNEAKLWRGSNNQICTWCKERILRGEWSKQNWRSGQVLHDACAEDAGAYEQVS